jgi:hypothetical protein
MNTIDALKRMMARIAMHVKFQYCYFLFLANIGFGIAFFIAVYILKIDAVNKMIVENRIGGFVGFVVLTFTYLGYIKYSQIIRNDKLHTYTSIIITIATVGFLIFGIPSLFDWLHKIGDVVPCISSFMLFYILREIKNDEVTYFEKLSSIYLALSIIYIIMGADRVSSGSWRVLKTSHAAFAVVSLIALYWNLKLFQHLYRKYEKVQLAKS